jgi:hypothetical protein
MSRDPCVQEDADLAAVAGACSSGPPQPQPSQSEVCVLLMQSTPTFTHTVCFLHSVQASSPTWFSYRGTSKQLVFQHSHDLDICRGQRQAAQKQACGCPASWRFWFIDDVSGANQTYHIPARSMQISILLYILIICINHMHACLCQANCNSSRCLCRTKRHVFLGADHLASARDGPQTTVPLLLAVIHQQRYVYLPAHVVPSLCLRFVDEATVEVLPCS